MLSVSQLKTWYGLECNGRDNLLNFIPLIWDLTVTGKKCFLRRKKFCPVSVPSQTLGGGHIVAN